MPSPQLTYYDLGERIVAFSTTRHGGVSQGDYGQLNVNPYCGDRLEHVAENRRLLAAALGIADSAITLPHQVHGTEMCEVTSPSADLEGYDALLTATPGLCVGVSTADCIPIIIYDPERHAACAVHAGWRGTVARIAVKAVERLRQTYGSRPEALRAVIGPGISLARFEVGQEVYDQFRAADFPMELIARKPAAKWHLDLPLCNRLQLESAGLLAERIKQSDVCTYDCVADYFSARRLGVASGRVYTAFILKP